MGTRERAASSREEGETGPSPEGWPEDAEWDALDRPQRGTVAGIAGSVWPLAVRVCPVCQMAGRRHIGSHISCIVRRRGYGRPELGLYLHQGPRKCQRRGKRADKAVGRTRGGSNTKLHTIVDGLGDPVGSMLSAGNDHDPVHAVELLKKVKISDSDVLADRAYGAKAIRAYISEQGASYVIPPQSNVSDSWPVDRCLYKDRHLVECFFQKLKTSLTMV